MVSHKLFSFIVLTSLLLFFFISPSHSSPDNDMVDVSNSNSDKVDLFLYYETLCPYCGNFIIKDLPQVFKTDLHTIVNLRLVPWGNAQIVEPNKTIECQHGQDECYFNIIEACALNVWPDLEKRFIFIRCVEYNILQNRTVDNETVWKFCAEYLKLNPESISDCYSSGLGTKLVLQYAKETDQLNPPHTYVPWVLVNNQPLYDDYENYVAIVCKAYKGEHPPKACKSLSRKINSNEKANSINPVDHAGEARQPTSFIPAEEMPRLAKASRTCPREMESSP